MATWAVNPISTISTLRTSTAFSRLKGNPESARRVDVLPGPRGAHKAQFGTTALVGASPVAETMLVN